jgi:DNA repair ATPase RecN
MNPFNLLKIKPQFEIYNLDEQYYKLYKTAEDKSALNQAYSVLKNDIDRAKTLCEINQCTQIDSNIAKEIMPFIYKSYEEKIKLLKEIQQNIIENACAANWKVTWHYLQKYSYIKRMVDQH